MLLVAATAAVGAWFVLLGVLAVATRAREPETGPPAMECGRSEPPAVVNFLVNGWQVRPDALPATLIDLAARKYLSIEYVRPEMELCHLPRKPTRSEELTAYERRVLDHVRGLAVDGHVPTSALATGDAERSKRWWKGFESAVVDDAVARGLSRPRWSRGALAVLSVAAAGPAVLVTLAFLQLQLETGEELDWEGIGAVVLAGPVLVWSSLMAVVRAMRSQRDTPAGLEAAGAWLGVREFLVDHGPLETVTAAGVTIWERLLAYGAALGAAPVAVASLPLGTRPDTWAWVPANGRWRKVTINYAGLGRRLLRWGSAPAWVVAEAVAWLGAGAFVGVVVAGPLAGPVLDEISDAVANPDGDSETGVFVALLVVPAVLLALYLGAMVRAVVLLVWGIQDLGPRRELVGTVLRVRTRVGGENDTVQSRQVAINDPDRTEIHAFEVKTRFDPDEGDVVRVAVSRRLGHVFTLEPATTSSRSTRGEVPPQSAQDAGQQP